MISMWLCVLIGCLPKSFSGQIFFCIVLAENFKLQIQIENYFEEFFLIREVYCEVTFL